MQEKISLLYVDDEMMNHFVFEANLREQFDIHVAISGSRAIEMLDEIAVQAVVTDQRMPQMSGVKLLEYIRLTFPRIARIVLSGYTGDQEIVEGMKNGTVEYCLSKPMERNQLVQILTKCLGD